MGQVDYDTNSIDFYSPMELSAMDRCRKGLFRYEKQYIYLPELSLVSYLMELFDKEIEDSISEENLFRNC